MHRSTAGSDHRPGMSRVINYSSYIEEAKATGMSEHTTPKRCRGVVPTKFRHAKLLNDRTPFPREIQDTNGGSGKTPCAAATSHVTPIRNQDTPKTGARGEALYGDMRVFAMVVSGWKPTKCGGVTLNSCGQCMTCGSCISLCWGGPRRHTRSGSSSVGEGTEQ